MTGKGYWLECILQAAADCGLSMTEEEAEYLADACDGARETYEQAFYMPPSSDSLAVIVDENEKKLASMKAKHELEMAAAELALKRSLGLYDDSIITVDGDGSVWLHNGEKVQVR